MDLIYNLENNIRQEGTILIFSLACCGCVCGHLEIVSIYFKGTILVSARVPPFVRTVHILYTDTDTDLAWIRRLSMIFRHPTTF